MEFDADIWQEYDCPVSGIDHDIESQNILSTGERFFCFDCGGYHTAGEDGPTSTIVRLEKGGDMIFRDLPQNAAEKAAWLAEVNAALVQANPLAT